MKVMCEMVECQQEDRKFDSQVMEPSNILSSKVKTNQQGRLDKADVINLNLTCQIISRSAETEKQTKGQTN